MVLDISDNPRCSSRENKFYVQETKLVFLKKKKKKRIKEVHNLLHPQLNLKILSKSNPCLLFLFLFVL